MANPRVRLSLAVSLDGFIATRDGGVDWLADFPAESVGFDEFLAEVGTIVMGRASFDQALGFGPWPYGPRRTIVVTSRAIESPPPGVEAWHGDVSALVAELRAAGGKDIWLFGGARTIRPFLDRELVDRVELAVMPVLLGDGIPLFGRSSHRSRLALVSATPHPNGIVMLVYERAER